MHPRAEHKALELHVEAQGRAGGRAVAAVWEQLPWQAGVGVRR